MSHDLFSFSTAARHAKFLVFGSKLGSDLLSNEDLIQRNGLDVDSEWIVRRSGIETRGFVKKGETLADLCIAAASIALERSGIKAENIDAVLLATDSSPVQTPALAPFVAAALGADNAVAFDVTTGCAGWGVITAQGAGLIASNQATNVLLIAGELLSDITDPKDLATAILFSDGAGAAVMTASDIPGVGPAAWGSEGEKWDVINMTLSRQESRLSGRPDLIEQEGPSVFRWATSTVPQAARKALDAAGVSIEDIAAFIPHQANLRIIDMVTKKLNFPKATVISTDVVTSGNASAGTIPIAIDHLLVEHPELSGKLALQMGFGAGLTWAGQVIVLP